MIPEVTVYACVDHRYRRFVLPLAASVLATGGGRQAVEIVHEGLDAADYAGIEILSNLFPFLLNVRRRDDMPGMPTSLYRFASRPHATTRFVHVTDADILHVEPMNLVAYQAVMMRTGLCYLNPVRAGLSRLTGVHFVETVPYFARITPWTVSNVLRELGAMARKQPGDERFLYTLCARHVGLASAGEQWRPLWGFHLSPNRKHWDDQAYAWGCREPGAKDRWEALKATEAWQAVTPHLNPTYLSAIETLEHLLRSC